MIETIFRCIIIFLLIVVIMTVITSATVSFNLGTDYMHALTIFLYLCYKFFPFQKLLPLIVCSISFTVFKITVSLIKAVWEIFPLRG